MAYFIALLKHAAHGEPVVAVSAVRRIHVRTIKTQSIGANRGIRRGRPIVAARASIGERTGLVAASEQEIRERPWAGVIVKDRGVLAI